MTRRQQRHYPPQASRTVARTRVSTHRRGARVAAAQRSVRRGGLSDRQPHQVARRSRRVVVLGLIVIAVVIAVVDFARGGITAHDRESVAPQGEERQVRADNTPSKATLSPSPSPSREPSPSPEKPKRPKVPHSASGVFVTVPGSSRVMGRDGPVLRYRVKVEKGIPTDRSGFADFVDDTLGDKRSWIRGGNVRLKRTSQGRYDFTIFLATPVATDRLCAPLPTNGYTSCRQGDKVVINLARWERAVRHWDRSLELYRRYVINHEVGHQLGHRHERCGGKGRLAPVMQQQTLRLAGCRGNAWPYVDGRRHTGPPGGYA